MTLGEAVRRRHIAQNPCRWVPGLPVQRTEIDYLRLAEIQTYLDACERDDWTDWYKRNVPLADDLLDAHLDSLRDDAK